MKQGKRMCTQTEIQDLIKSVKSASLTLYQGYIPTCTKKVKDCQESDFDYLYADVFSSSYLRSIRESDSVKSLKELDVVAVGTIVCECEIDT